MGSAGTCAIRARADSLPALGEGSKPVSLRKSEEPPCDVDFIGYATNQDLGWNAIPFGPTGVRDLRQWQRGFQW
jgi:hypothetical protein